MKERRVTAALIEAQGRALQDLRYQPERAEELAAEVGRMNQAVRESAEDLEFDDEPRAFESLLRRHARAVADEGAEEGPAPAGSGTPEPAR